MILLKNCRLIKELTEGYDEATGDVVISDDNKIAKICRCGDIKDFDGQVYDINGNTLLPGFFDLHTHLYMSNFDFTALDARNVLDTTFDMYKYAREYLKQGYTTIRDAGCPFNVTAGMEKAFEKGIINIPRLISSGIILTPTELGNDSFKVLYDEVDGPMEVRKAARDVFKKGNDVVKYMITGAYLNEAGVPGQTIASEDEIKEAVSVAKSKDSYVMGHAHSAEGVKRAIRCGVYTIEHGSFMDDEAIEMLKKETSYLIPTAAIGLASIIDGEEQLTANQYEKAKKYERAEKEALNKAYNAGLKMGFGSDIDMAHFMANPGMEFIARTDFYDFKYKDILLQATKNSAEISGLSDVKGTIKEGKNAELVVIEGKPDEDIYAMKKMPLYVFYNGEVIKN